MAEGSRSLGQWLIVLLVVVVLTDYACGSPSAPAAAQQSTTEPATVSCQSYCQLVLTICPQAAVTFSSLQGCEDHCTTDLIEGEATALSGKSRACRWNYTRLAQQQPKRYCIHAVGGPFGACS